MNYFSKTIILHQIENGFSVHNKAISGICRLENEDGIFKCYLTFMNIEKKQKGEFGFCLLDENKQLFSINLGSQITNYSETFTQVPIVQNKFSVGLYFVENNIPILIAYSNFNNGESIVSMKKTLYERHIKTPIKTTIEEIKPKITVEDVEIVANTKTNDEDIIKEIHSLYDDEAVATENYFDGDEEIQKKLDFIAKFENEHFGENEETIDKQENEQVYDDEINKIFEEIEAETIKEEVAPTLDTATATLTKEKEKIENLDDFLSNAKGVFENLDVNDIGDRSKQENVEYSESNPYYEQVKEEIKAVFEKFPEELSLKRILPHSKFVKINYAENKFYVIGVIYEMSKVKYICYGVPDKYSKNPPKELKGYCQFIPLSMFNIAGEGYWMMFQDAVNGSCVKLK